MAAKKKLTANQAQLEKDGANAARRRQRWEKTDEGLRRMTDVAEVGRQQTEQFIRDNPELYPDRDLETNPVQRYPLSHYYQDAPGQYSKVAPKMFWSPGMTAAIPEQQLPGMSDPDAVVESTVKGKGMQKLWEDYTDDERAHTLRQLKARTGATLDSMTQAFGAQLDQAHMRAARQEAIMPAATDFYEEGEPAQIARDQSNEHSVRFGQAVAANSLTSPNMKFHVVNKKTGEEHYPNAIIAGQAIQQAKAGVNPEDAVQVAGYGGSAYPDNFAKAVHVVQQTDAGVPMSEFSHMFGPKTSQYNNAWLPSHPNRTVVDMHTGAGVLPHVSISKSGKDKSDVEKTLEIARMHAAADFSARTAAAQRGFTSVNEDQAAQWQEQRIQRGLITEEQAYKSYTPTPPRQSFQDVEMPGINWDNQPGSGTSKIRY